MCCGMGIRRRIPQLDIRILFRGLEIGYWVRRLRSWGSYRWSWILGGYTKGMRRVTSMEVRKVLDGDYA